MAHHEELKARVASALSNILTDCANPLKLNDFQESLPCLS
jgi:hypothetical protein